MSATRGETPHLREDSDALPAPRQAAVDSEKRQPPTPTEPLPFDQTEAYDSERKYLEGLLSARPNFYLVFASLLIAGLLGSDSVTPELRLLGSVFGSGVSAIIGYSVWRTHRLVDYILERIYSTGKHPYADARAWIEWKEPRVRKTNANAAFAQIPFGLLFALLALLTLLSL